MVSSLDAPSIVALSDVNPDVLIDTPMELTLNEDSVKKSLETIFATPYASRPFRRRFGTRIMELLYEPVDGTTANKLETMLSDTASLWEPRISIVLVVVLPDTVNQRYYVDLRYTIPRLGNKMVNYKFHVSK